MTITIYHNPKCSNSRRALEFINASGSVPRVVDYQKNPLSRDELAALVQKMGVPVRGIVREKEPLFASLHLDNASDDQLLDAVAAHPILLNRPIVVTDKGAKLCRPPEVVKSLL
ncbi:MAG TPA: arsenate reductase (glutaredoxin) [Rhizomicrobium sp.]|nr:arsenate reductase (glutaredoxin) [Rhizomicrobium sp.]